MHIRAMLILFSMILPGSALAGDHYPQRIVSLKPNVTDIVYALGAGEELVGVTRYCDIPAGAKKPEIVGDYAQAFVERIVAQGPTIVIGSMENSSRRSIESLERMGMRVEMFPFTTLAETLDSIRGIGEALERPDDGRKLAARIEEKLGALKKRWSAEKPVKAVVVWGLKPLIVAGHGTYMDEMMEFIGTENAVRATKVKYPRIGLEELISMDPEAIVDLSMGSEGDGQDARPWKGVGQIMAVRNGRIVRLDASRFRAGPLLPEALEKLAGLIHKR
ncbi:MAG: helical backbone metal receptor [Pseudomonadota bacterium]